MEKEADVLNEVKGIEGIDRVSRDLLSQPQDSEPLRQAPPFPDIYSWPPVQEVSPEMLSRQVLLPDVRMNQDLRGEDPGGDADLLSQGLGSTTIIRKR